MRCAVFASGGGSNFQALLDQKTAGNLHVDFTMLISNNSKSGACERAKKYHIPVFHFTQAHFPNEYEYAQKLIQLLDHYKVELIILAGYMKKLPSELIDHYRYRIVNIHPGLLPAFGGKGMYGHHVHQAVLEYGAKVSGVTVHFVDEEYDHGPVILQETVQVMDNDTAETLAARVLALEHASYWRAIDAISKGKLRVEGRKVIGNV
jgi:phosphoribosylglycinamide formyltransferase-1